MLEARLRALSWLTPFFYGELLWRQLRDPRRGPKRVVFLSRFGRAPGQRADFFYRGGLELYLWPDLPHRVRGFVTNKLVASSRYAVWPDSRRFTHDPLFVFELEVFL